MSKGTQIANIRTARAAKAVAAVVEDLVREMVDGDPERLRP